MNTEQALTKLFCSNFVAYYRSHASHANVVGRNFYSDHKLLQKIYEDLQSEIDTLAELLRTIDLEVPEIISEILDESDVFDTKIIDLGTGLGYLTAVYDDLETLIGSYIDLEESTKDSMDLNHLANYAQDRVRTLHKFCWMLRSTMAGRRDSDLD